MSKAEKVENYVVTSISFRQLKHILVVQGSLSMQGNYLDHHQMQGDIYNEENTVI